MKKVFLLFAVAAVFAACGPKAAKEEAPEVVEPVVVEEVIPEATTDTTVQCTDTTSTVVAE